MDKKNRLEENIKEATDFVGNKFSGRCVDFREILDDISNYVCPENLQICKKFVLLLLKNEDWFQRDFVDKAEEIYQEVVALEDWFHVDSDDKEE